MQHILKGVPITKLELNDLFDELDSDGSRTVSIVEMRDLLQAVDAIKTYNTTIRDSQSLTDGMTAEEAEANDLVPDTPDNPRSTRAPRRGGATVAPAQGSLAALRRATLAASVGKSKTSLAPTEDPPTEDPPAAATAPRALAAGWVAGRGSVQAQSMKRVIKRVDSTIFRKPKNTDSSQLRRLSREAVKAVRKNYIHRAAEDLDMGFWENFKTFRLFPVLAKLQYADHVARVAFPVAFAIFIFSELGAVGWFEPHYERLSHSKCYLDSR